MEELGREPIVEGLETSEETTATELGQELIVLDQEILEETIVESLDQEISGGITVDSLDRETSEASQDGVHVLTDCLTIIQLLGTVILITGIIEGFFTGL